MEEKKIKEYGLNTVYTLAALGILYFQTAVIFGLWDILPVKQSINVTIFLPLYGLILALSKRFTLSHLMISIVQLGVYYLNEFVGAIRKSCVQFVDIYCINDAVRVAWNYRPIMTKDIALTFLAAALINVAVFVIFLWPEKRKIVRRLCGVIPGVMGAVIITAVLLMESVLDPPFYEVNKYTKENGLPLALLSEYKYSRNAPSPDGYTKKAAQEIYASYAGEEQLPGDVDVIVIMNEALADFTLVGTPDFSADPLEYIHSLDENCAKGKLLVSVFGGSTCCTEFEFLTGASLCFLPDGSKPYLQYIHEDLFSVCRDMCFDNYRKTAVHPYLRLEWRRNENYPLLGFEEFISGENFSDGLDPDFDPDSVNRDNQAVDFGDGIEYIRGLISDRECYSKILSVLDQEDSPSFIFAVTIQNHGDYLVPGFETTEYVTGKSGQAAINQYLTLTAHSDEAFEYLLTELSKRDRKAVVLMFGDHQPWLEESIAQAVDFDSSKCEYSYNVVPYILWANYPAELEMPEITSPNYLSAYLKKNAGLPLNSWDNIRLNAAQSYPALSSIGTIRADNEIVSAEEAADDEALRDYYYVQYDMMFN